jgi:hypothetical protein
MKPKTRKPKKPREWILVQHRTGAISHWSLADAKRFDSFFDADSERIHVREVLPKRKVKK